MNSQIVLKYFPELTEAQKGQIESLGSLYADWNEKINVVSRKDIDFLYERHVLHSLAIAKFIKFQANTNVLDVGTGGGFPGIPLAILFPESKFHLVDSIGKKIKVCREIAESIGLENLTADHSRMEKVRGDYDFVVSRAVAQSQQLINWTGHLISGESNHEISNGWLLLKGGDLNEELSAVNNSKKLVQLSDYFSTPFFATKALVHISSVR